MLDTQMKLVSRYGLSILTIPTLYISFPLRYKWSVKLRSQWSECCKGGTTFNILVLLSARD